MSGRLTEGFRKIIELRWNDFAELEKDDTRSNFDAVISGVVRACQKGNLRAIQVALDRLDGKIAVEVEVEYPKFYTLYPRATMAVDDPGIIDLPVSPRNPGKNQFQDNPKMVLSGAADLEELDAETEELPTGSLRAVLEKMLNSPKDIVTQILTAAKAIDTGQPNGGNPLVKSVIVAGLMRLVHEGRVNAVFEVFDQIDGKVADKVKVLGNDVFITRYDLIAPAGAVKNEQGIYQLEASNTTDVWAARLGAGKGR